MIRLAVFGVNEQRCKELARRLCGVELIWLAEEPESAIERPTARVQETVIKGIEEAIFSAARQYFGDDKIEVHVDPVSGHPTVKRNGQEVDVNELGDLVGRLAAQSVLPVTLRRLRERQGQFDAVVYLGAKSPGVDEIERFMYAGKHVLLATETILSAGNLESIIDRATSKGVRVVVVNPDRMLPSRQLIHDELRGTKFGAAGLIRIHRWQRYSTEAVTDLPAALIRDLDLVLWLTWQLPNSVYAIQRLSQEGKPEAGGAIQVHLGFAEGGMALIDFADCLPSGDGYQSLSAICSTGAMYADDHANSQLAYRGGTAQAHPADEGRTAMVNCLSQFAEALATGGEMHWGSSAQWGSSLAPLRIVVSAVRKSIETGLAVSLEE